MRTSLLKVLFLAMVSATSMSSNCVGEILLPGSPDVVFQCLNNGLEVAGCQFSCMLDFTVLGPIPLPRPGPPPANPPAPPQEKRPGGIFLMDVSRVEFYSGGATGRTDTRSWVAIQSGAQKFSTVLWVGPTMFCQTVMGSTLSGPNWTVQKFVQ